jgi:predicted nucleic acid-binding protein
MKRPIIVGAARISPLPHQDRHSSDVAWPAAGVHHLQVETQFALERYHDQDFTLTDAVSFEVMRRERIRQAFAFDGHFVTAGFELLS